MPKPQSDTDPDNHSRNPAPTQFRQSQEAKIKVLVVDDDPPIGSVVKGILPHAEYEVQTAIDGADGVRKASEFLPDVILLDIAMPSLDGWEVLRELQKRKIPTRVILISGEYIESRHIVRGIKAGACDFIEKPWKKQSLVAAVKRTVLLDSQFSDRPSSGLIAEALIDRVNTLERQLQLSPREDTLTMVIIGCLAFMAIATAAFYLPAKNTAIVALSTVMLATVTMLRAPLLNGFKASMKALGMGFVLNSSAPSRERKTPSGSEKN